MGLSPLLFPSRPSSRRLYLKRPLLLLEVLIGLALTGILLTLLFTSISRIAKIETKLHTARTTLLSRQHLQMRLQDLFMGLTHFHTQRFPHEKHDSLIITFNHGIDPDPAFSGEVLGRIYLDEEQNLSLVIWPLKEETPWRKEILLSHVEECHFEFLGPDAATSRCTWHTHWSKEQQQLPIAIRLKIEKNSSLPFAFLLPSSHQIITYYEGGLSS